MKHLPALATLSLIGLVGMPALAQSRSDRVSNLTSALSGSIDDGKVVYTDANSGQSVRATPRQLMRKTLTNVDYDQMPGKLALEVWSDQTGVPLVVNWAALRNAGVDPDSPVTLQLRGVPADQVLKLIVGQLHPDPIDEEEELILDIEQWYVRVMTKRDALRRSTTRMYFIGDLLMTIPNFENAPKFDLNDALSNTNSGGSNGNGGGGNNSSPFGDNDDDREKEVVLSKQEKAERIADVIRDGIEPSIWRANGGEYASIRYLRGMLIVKAPEFVHDQIGVPVTGASSERRTTSRRDETYRSNRQSDTQPRQNHRRSTTGGVAGTAPSGPKLVR